MLENAWVLTVDRDIDYGVDHWADDRDSDTVLGFGYNDQDRLAAALAEYLGVEGKYDTEAMAQMFCSLPEASGAVNQTDLLEAYIERHGLQKDFNAWWGEYYG